MDDHQSTRRANKKYNAASQLDCGVIRRRDAPADVGVLPNSSFEEPNSSPRQNQENQSLQVAPDKAILRLARALARQAAREDHARECADKARHYETSRDLCPLLDRSSG
jgi:hypothetical protein